MPFLISICILSQYKIFEENKKIWLFSIVFIIFWGIYARPSHPLFYKGSMGFIIPYKGIVADEITFYYEYSSLYRKIKYGELSENIWSKKGRELKQKNEKFVNTNYGIGILGYNAGPSVYIFDRMALADPLLSKLPAYKYSRIGHFKRIIPDGYLQTIVQGDNLIADKNLADFYNKLSTITRGPIFSKQRFIEIIKMNLGFYNHLLKKYSDTIIETLQH
jgi:arabinofuranosyltransferase